MRKSKLEVEQAVAAVAEKDAALSALTQEQVTSASSQLSSVQTQLHELQSQLETERSAFQSEKKSLEDAITELGTVEERARAEQEDVKGEIRKHVQAAREAQLKLNEVSKSVETLSTDLAEAREQLNKVRQEAGSTGFGARED